MSAKRESYKIMRIYSYHNSGFTLIEILISLFILTVSMTAAMYLLQLNNADAQYIKDSYIASGLVKEGVEVVHNIRDSDWLAGLAFGTSIPDGTYRVKRGSTGLIALGANPTLKKDEGSGFYNYNATGTDTTFQRTVTIATLSAFEKQVVVTVTWQERGRSRTISAEEHLFNWR